MAKNTMLKTRSFDNPYEVYVNLYGWEWRVLKKYQADDHKLHARWFCAVRSPYTHGSWDYGDVYAEEVLDNAQIVKAGSDEASTVKMEV